MKTPEANRPSQPTRHCEVAEQFLFSKTEAQPHTRAVTSRPFSIAAQVLAAFPQILAGSDFMKHALEQLEQEPAFGALVVRADVPPNAEDSTKADQVEKQLHIARLLDRHCNTTPGLWGLVNHNLFGCFCLAPRHTVCRDMAHALQRDFHQHTGTSVSIGYTTYPLLDYNKLQVLENAHKALRHAAFFGPGTCTRFDAVSLNISGDEKYQTGDIEGAAQEFAMGLRLDPSDVNLYNSLGVCFGVLKQYDKAWRAFDAALQVNPHEVMALYNAGLIRSLEERHDEALDYFLKAAKQDKDCYEPVLQTGKLYLTMQNPQKARPHLEKAARLNPTDGRPFVHLGRCYHEMQLQDLAIGAFEKAIRQNPFDAEALSFLGLLYGEKGENAEIATLFCQKSIDIEPENGCYHSRLGKVHLKYDRLQQALSAFENASVRGWDATADIEKIRNRLTVKAS